MSNHASALGWWSGVVVSIFTPSDYMPPGSAVYVLVRRDYLGLRHPLYVGEAENCSDRVGRRHEKWAAAVALGMNEIHVHLLAQTRAQRLAIETHLRHALRPPLNTQLAPLWWDRSPTL